MTTLYANIVTLICNSIIFTITFNAKSSDLQEFDFMNSQNLQNEVHVQSAGVMEHRAKQV